MSSHENPDDLGRLLRDAVDEIEPRPGIDTIRSRTAQRKESPMNSLRSWLLGGFGAAVATAAVIGGVVLVGNNNPSADRDDDPAGSPTGQVSETTSEKPSESPSEPASDDPTSDPSPTGDATGSDGPPPQTGRAMAVYFLGDTPHGPRLYREYQRGTGGDASDAVEVAVSGEPRDPDYRSPWPDDAKLAGVVTVEGDVITVDLTGNVHDRPAGMTDEVARLAVEQVIYTAQGAVGRGRLLVQFLIDHGRTDQVLGQPASEPLANRPENDVLSLVSITSPEEGMTVSGSFQASGRANSFEATVPWQILRGDVVVVSGFSTAEGSMDKLYPWSTKVDVSDLAPGRYTFRAQTDDPSGGAEGAGPFTDTRTIVVE